MFDTNINILQIEPEKGELIHQVYTIYIDKIVDEFFLCKIIIVIKTAVYKGTYPFHVMESCTLFYKK